MSGLEWILFVLMIGAILLFLGLNWVEDEADKRKDEG